MSLQHIMAKRSIVLTVMFLMAAMGRVSSQNYADALTKSILFFEGQRSGKLPASQRMTWRKDSGLKDGSDVNMDLVGGYYDAGDNVKYLFPMAFTTTMLAWSVVEFGHMMDSDLQHALDAIRWGTDFMLKATRTPNVVVALVGEPVGDHICWERPEDMDTPRTAYMVTKEKPGSEVSAEIAAALAASSIAFRSTDAKYSQTLLDRAKQVFDFANTYRGSYNDSIGFAVCPFYCDFSSYMDELIWGAAWLYKATNKSEYRMFVKENMKWFDFSGFGWDAKNAGINVLMSKLEKLDQSNYNNFVQDADRYVCSLLPNSPTKSVSYTPGGLIYRPNGPNMQHVTSLSFLAVVYARYMQGAKKVAQCQNVTVTPSQLVSLVKSQVDYMLGKNPLGMSYMVGYGQKFPQHIHHRAATMPSMDQLPHHMQCHEGDSYFKLKKPDPNLLTGAIIGGPAEDDSFEDARTNIAQSEPTTYINAPAVGLLAYFKARKHK